MIKKSLIKNIPFKKINKLVSKKIKNKDLRSFSSFYIYLCWLESKKIHGISTFLMNLIDKKIFEDCHVDKNKYSHLIKEWFLSKSNEIEAIRPILTNLHMNQDLYVYIFLFFFEEDSQTSAFDIRKKYLFLHKKIFEICRKNFPENINEIIVFLNLIKGKF